MSSWLLAEFDFDFDTLLKFLVFGLFVFGSAITGLYKCWRDKTRAKEEREREREGVADAGRPGSSAEPAPSKPVPLAAPPLPPPVAQAAFPPAPVPVAIPPAAVPPMARRSTRSASATPPSALRRDSAEPPPLMSSGERPIPTRPHLGPPRDAQPLVLREHPVVPREAPPHSGAESALPAASSVSSSEPADSRRTESLAERLRRQEAEELQIEAEAIHDVRDLVHHPTRSSLRRAVILSQLLGPPLALQPPDERL